MNILFISQYFHPEPFSNNEIARALVERDHAVDVVCCVPNYPDGVFYPGYSNSERRVERWEGIRIVRARTVARGKTATMLMLNYLVYPAAALITVWRKGREQYDVSFTSMPSPIFQSIVAVVLKRLRGVPAVYWVQDIWPDSLVNTVGIRNRFARAVLYRLCAFLYRQADIVLVQSEAFRPKLVAMGVASERIAFFPNSAPDGFRPVRRMDVDPAITALLPAASLRLMFAGNVGESQNLDVIVAAADRLRSVWPVQWVILGSGRDLDRIRLRVVEMGLEDVVIFVGRHPMSSMGDFYAMADAMIISLKDTEIFRMTVPYKLQSYLRAGKPVIGSISGETRRIVETANVGFCGNADDVDGLCNAVLQFAALDEAGRSALANNAMSYFEQHYSPSVVFEGLQRHLLAAARPAAVAAEG